MFIKLTMTDGKPIWLKNTKFVIHEECRGNGTFINGSVVKETSEEILAMIEGKGPPTQPEEGRMKHHISYLGEIVASFRHRFDRNAALTTMTGLGTRGLCPEDDE